MSCSRFCRDASALAATLVLLSAPQARATSQNWDGGSSVFWTNNVNWSSDLTLSAPAKQRLLTLFPAANFWTNINIAGLSRIKYITFDTYNVAKLTPLAANNAMARRSSWNDANYKLNGNAGNSQNFNASIMLGLDRNGGALLFPERQYGLHADIFGRHTDPNKRLDDRGQIDQHQWRGQYLHSRQRHHQRQRRPDVNRQQQWHVDLRARIRSTDSISTGTPSSVIDIGKGYLYIDSVGGNGINAAQSGVINEQASFVLAPPAQS